MIVYREFLSTLKNKASNWLCRILANQCLLCDHTTYSAATLCLACEQGLPRIRYACKRCGIALLNSDSLICGACLQNPPRYSRCLAPFDYLADISYLVTTLKFNHQLRAAHTLGKLLSDYLILQYQQQPKPLAIIPVPLHAQRLQERGFNQAVEVARVVAKRLRIPLLLDHCIRLRNTAAQSTLSVNERARNVANVFRVQKTIAQRSHVAILDDVITTGNTIEQLSAALKQHGVQQIDVWCCARTSLRKK